MSNVSNGNPTGGINAQFLNQIWQAKDVFVDNAAGQGVLGGQNGTTPPVDPQVLSNLRASLAALGLNMQPQQVDVLIVQVAIDMRDTESQSTSKRIDIEQSAARGKLDAQAQKIDEMVKKQEEARKKQESASLIDKIKLAFEWIGAALAVVVAVVAIATGAGAVVGALLLAAAMCAIASAVNSTVQTATGKGIGQHIGEAAGMSPEDAAKLDQAINITLAVAGALFSLAAAPAGAVSAVMKTAFTAARAAGDGVMKATGEALKAGVKFIVESMKAAVQSAKSAMKDALAEITEEGLKTVVKEAAENALKSVKAGVEGLGNTRGIKLMEKAADIGETVNTMGTTATNMSSSIVRSDATRLQAMAKDAKAESKKDEAALAMMNQAIDMLFARLIAAGDRFNAILDGVMEARNDRAQFTARAHFAG